MTVEATWAKKRRVEHVWAVGCRDKNHVGLRIEAIHFNQQLVEGLLALVVAAADTGTALTTNCIDFVYEDDGWGALLGLFEQVANTRGTNTDEHFDKVRTRD